MQHIPATIEEQLILKAIKEECHWDNLPKRLQSTLNSKEEWHRRIIEHCIKKRLQWNTSFARKVCKEAEYYEDMMRYLRKNLALFPYHLAEYVCRVMRISPFRYYCDMIFDVMKNEQPYDSIPNFSAADALRLTGVGRNEFIDIMNKCRSKKIMWKLNKSIAKELLPVQPVDFAIDPWWGVCLVNFTLEEFKKLSEEETATIDKICKEEANSFILFDSNIIRGLYRRGLVYFDVPVYPEDRFKVCRPPPIVINGLNLTPFFDSVSRLEGFVSNREQSYEDPIEELLYAVFVVSNENATVAELAATLQADLSQLQAAASFTCRLGWAIKIIDPGSVLRDFGVPSDPSSILSDDEDGSHASISSGNVSAESSALQMGSGVDISGSTSGDVRVAFVVDANITSYLMMGSVSPGLKSHAVTLYEAGKLGHASIPDLCKDLSSLEGAKFEGELQEFANHAHGLRCVLECLLSGGVEDETRNVEANFLTPVSSHSASANIDQLIGFEPLESDVDNTIAPEGCSDVSGLANETADNKYMGSPVDDKSGLVEDQKGEPDLDDDKKATAVEESCQGAETKKKRNYRVDILRCESLAALAPATLDRLFLRDYDIVVSMVPLPQSSILPGPQGPIHFGPPSHASMTPWMKLALYSSSASGPISVVLMKGQCLRLLPAPLAGCEKALIWSWDGSSIGGLGSKFEGNLVKGNILLHCLNSLLKHSAILVQPLSQGDLDESGKTITMDIPLPLKNKDGSVTWVEKEFGLSVDDGMKLGRLLSKVADAIELPTIGYIRLLKLLKENEFDTLSPDKDEYEWVPLDVQFGIPLFSPKLCNSMCRRVVSSQLLQSDLFSEHHDAMQSLRKKLRDLCLEFQATGLSAKLLYQKEQPREHSRLLMNYASGRWNPLTDPSSPISGASSEHQRLKLANRHRNHTEVLSFDGSVLRSYALSPVYETKAAEETNMLNATKSENEDADSKEVVLPGVNLLFDGAELHPFDIGACLQARQPVSLIAEASAASSSLAVK